MIAAKLENLLKSEQIYYGKVEHPRRESAEACAVSAQIPPYEMAKIVMVKIDGRIVMTVLCSNERLDLERLKKLTGAKSVDLAHEDEFRDLFDDCEVGAMPPFGNLYNLQEFVDVRLGDRDMIAFNAGSHTEVLELPYKVFEKLSKPVIASIACH